MNKRGSHVGVVLSFVIFITFVLFLYSILGPTIVTEDKESFLDYLRIEIIEKLSANLTRITVSIEFSEASCIKLVDFLENAEIESNIIVKDSEEEIISAEILENDLIVNRIDNQKDFFKIHYSEVFEELPAQTTSHCEELEEGEYSITLVRTEDYLFEKNIMHLIENIEEETEYEKIKEELRIPEDTEVGIVFINSGGLEMQTSEEEIETSVYAREIPIQYVDEESNILLGTIIIKIW